MSSRVARFALPAAACSLIVVACSSSPETAADGAIVAPDAPCNTGPGTTTLSKGIARGVVVDDGFAYTANVTGLLRVRRTAGPPENLVSADSPVGLAIDATTAYFFAGYPAGMRDEAGKIGTNTGLFSIPLAGGSATRIVEDVWGENLISDGETLYWSVSDGVRRLRLGTTTPTQLPFGRIAQISGMALGRTALFLAMQTFDGGVSAGSIVRMPLSGEPMTTVLGGLQGPTSIALDERSIYFTDGYSGSESARLVRVGIDGQGATTLATGVASSVAVDGHAVYYTTQNAVMKVAKADGAISRVAGGLDTPGYLTVHGGNVYWANATLVAMSAVDPPYALMTACK